MDTEMGLARGGFAYGTEEHKKEKANEWIRYFERTKKGLEKALKNPQQDKK